MFRAQNTGLGAQCPELSVNILHSHGSVVSRGHPEEDRSFFGMSINGVHWLLNRLKIFENASLWLILFFKENPKKTFLWAISAFYIFPEKEILEWKMQMRFLTLFPLWPQFPHLYWERGWTAEHECSFLLGHFPRMSFGQTRSCLKLASQAFRGCSLAAMFLHLPNWIHLGPHMLLFLMWYCLSWPQKQFHWEKWNLKKKVPQIREFTNAMVFGGGGERIDDSAIWSHDLKHQPHSPLLFCPLELSCGS